MDYDYVKKLQPDHPLGRRHVVGLRRIPTSWQKSLAGKRYGIRSLYANTEIPKKRSKKNPLTAEDKARNKAISKERVLVENIIGDIKKSRIISERYRNRRKRFSLRFNIIAAVHNHEC